MNLNTISLPWWARPKIGQVKNWPAFLQSPAPLCPRWIFCNYTEVGGRGSGRHGNSAVWVLVS